MTVLTQCIVKAVQEVLQIVVGGAGFGRCSRKIAQLESEVQSSQDSDAVACFDFSGIADFAHGFVHLAHRSVKTFFSTGWAAQDVALPHDLNFNLAHAVSLTSTGRRSNKPSMRLRAACKRDLRESRS